MKIAIVGPKDWSSWRALEDVIAYLGQQDSLVHTGSYSVGGKCDRIVGRRTRSRRPTVIVQWPETARYPELETQLVQNALQVCGFQRPDALVYVAETGEEPDVKPYIEMAEKYHILVQTADEFVAARTQRV